MQRRMSVGLIGLCLLLVASARPLAAADIFVRFKVTEPAGDKFSVSVSGFRHTDPWHFPGASAEVAGGAWSEWVDVSAWPWHGRIDRQGGFAEWPSMTLSAARVGGDGTPIKGVSFDVQLADKADEKAVVHSFTERSESATIGFLVPNPLRENAKEFETGSQMTARQLAWAKEAIGGDKPAPKFEHFKFLTSLWGPYDPALARQNIETLKLLGFNVIGNADAGLLRQMGVRTYNATWLYEPDPREVERKWKEFADGDLKTALATEDGKWQYAEATHWVLADEVSALDLRGLKPEDLSAWFRTYLRDHGVTDQDLGKPIDQVEYPAAAMYAETLPHDADLPTRRLMYHAAKFGHWWSVKQLRLINDQIKATLPGARTETLPGDHGFYGAWGATHLGMNYRMLDLFEFGAQRAIDELSAEDWMGLNHMYGPGATWTGAQLFEYFHAVCRSSTLGAPADQPIELRSLITPSDDQYLRLKAYSGLGQGSKSIFFWTFGPTYIGTENYWSDLRSMYDGIAKVARAMENAEPVLYPAKPVRDPVAILYSVSHDIWHNNDPAPFVEKRLLWHALRHLHVQPDFIREEDVEGGRLKDYKLLYVVDSCVTRKASAKIEEWVKGGGYVYLSAGASTRDEFFEPYVPPYAATVFPDDAAAQVKKESHSYNERRDLPRIDPMTTAKVEALPGKEGEVLTKPVEVRVLGWRGSLRDGIEEPLARFADVNKPAVAVVAHGSGRVMGLGFLPMLAYGQGANFKPTTLEEKWPEGPRQLPRLALEQAGVTPVARASVPVVETSLLTGEKGSALVLVNYTYEPVDALTVDLKLDKPVTRATSIEGVDVKLEKTADGVRLNLPLKWTDIIVLE